MEIKKSAFFSVAGLLSVWTALASGAPARTYRLSPEFSSRQLIGISLTSALKTKSETTMTIPLVNHARQETLSSNTQIQTTQSFTEEIIKTDKKNRPITIRRTYQQDEHLTVVEPADPDQEAHEATSLTGQTLVFNFGNKEFVAAFQGNVPPPLHTPLHQLESLFETYSLVLPPTPVKLNETWTIKPKQLAGKIKRLPIPQLEKHTTTNITRSNGSMQGRLTHVRDAPEGPVALVHLSAAFEVEYAMTIAFTESDPDEEEGLHTKGTAKMTLLVMEVGTLEIQLTTRHLVSHHSTTQMTWTTDAAMEEPTPMNMRTRGHGTVNHVIRFSYPLK